MKNIVNYAKLVKERHALNETIAPVEVDQTDASRDYAVGDQLIYDSILYDVIDDIAQHGIITAEGAGANIEAARSVTEQIASQNEALTNKLNNEIVTRSALGVKNILPFDLAEIKALNTNGTWAGNVYTYRGVAFTVNSDGTISATGTATGGNASIKLFAASSNYEMLGKEVILTGCPSNGSASTYRIQAYRMASADGSTGTYFDDGAGTDAFTVLNDASGTVGSFAVAVYENATVTNLLFKPMVRLASDPDATYQPYAKTNRELTAENQTLTNNVDVLAENGAVNLLPNGATTDTINGVTFTVNTDGTVTANGEATADANLILSESFYVGSGKAIRITGCPSDGSSTTYFLRLTAENSTTSKANDTGDGADYTTTENYYGARIVVRGGTTVSNLTFKPMIADAKFSGDYVPYAKTNRELTELLGNEVTSVTENGVTANFSKWGKVCTISWAGAFNTAVERDVSFLTIPNGYIPLWDNQMMSTNKLASLSDRAILNIKYNGTITIAGVNVAVGDSLRGSFTYITK